MNPTILNTTFVVHTSAEAHFIEWAKEVYVAAAVESGLFSAPTIARILAEVDPEARSYAVQMRCPSLADAQRWHDGTAALLRDDLRARWADKVLFFTTYMEVVG